MVYIMLTSPIPTQLVSLLLVYTDGPRSLVETWGGPAKRGGFSYATDLLAPKPNRVCTMLENATWPIKRFHSANLG